MQDLLWSALLVIAVLVDRISERTTVVPVGGMRIGVIGIAVGD
jgi:hypothetical protein